MVIASMHLKRLGQNGFEIAARFLANHLVWYMTTDVGDCWLKAATRFAHFSAYSTSQVSSIGTRARDQVYQDIVLVTLDVCAERQSAEPASPADGFVDLDVRQKQVTGVCVERTLAASGQLYTMLLH